MQKFNQEQPLPAKGKHDVSEELIKYIRQRQAKGIETYGRSLESRDVLRDLLEELLDAAQYTMQTMLERDEHEAVIKQLEDKIKLF